MLAFLPLPCERNRSKQCSAMQASVGCAGQGVRCAGLPVSEKWPSVCITLYVDMALSCRQAVGAETTQRLSTS